MVSINTARLLKIFALQIVQYLPFNSFVVSSAYKERKPLALRSALFHSSEKANNVPILEKEHEIHGQVFSQIKLWEGKVKVQLFREIFITELASERLLGQFLFTLKPFTWLEHQSNMKILKRIACNVQFEKLRKAGFSNQFQCIFLFSI